MGESVEQGGGQLGIAEDRGTPSPRHRRYGLITSRQLFSLPWSCAARSTMRSCQVPAAGWLASVASFGTVAAV